jgi:hypothetical protein
MRITLLKVRHYAHINMAAEKNPYRCESIESNNFKGRIILDKTNSEDTDLDLGSRV